MEDSFSTVSENTPEDLHICGTCKSQFCDIEEFVRHKRQKCGVQVSAEEIPHVISKTYSKLNNVAVNDETSPDPPSAAPNLTQAQSLSSYECPSATNGTSTEPIDCNNKEKEMDNHKLNLLVSHPTCQTPAIDNNNIAKSTATNSSIGDKNMKRKKKFKCNHDGCSYSSAYPKDLQRHLRVHTGERPFVCDICKKTFNRPDKLKVHLRHHTGVKPYKCTECDYATGDSSSLKKHLRIHTDERPFKCQICQYASRNSSQLVVHLRTHTGDAPFQCPQCPNKFKINSDLKRHMRLHTGEKPYMCNFCDYRCAIKGNLKTHVRLNHSTENLQKCGQCDFSSPSRKVLKQHEKSHMVRSIKCTYPQCSYSCKSRASLLNHSRTHSDDRPFKCDYCPYASRQRGNVRTHLKKRHPEKMPRSRRLNAKRKPVSSLNSDCQVSASAPEQGSRANSVDSHSNAVGMRSTRSCRPLCVTSFKCNLCDSAFVREDSLRSHVRQHQKMEPSTQCPEDEITPASPAFEISKVECSDADDTIVAQQISVESLVQCLDYDDCILSTELNGKGGNRDQVIEEALRQSGVLCMQPSTLGSTIVNAIPKAPSNDDISDVASQTTTSYFISDCTTEASDVITTMSCPAPQTIQTSTLQTPISSVDTGTILMNATNLEIPLTSNNSGTHQLIYLRLIPSVHHVLQNSPSGCTQILLNADDNETLQFHDGSLLQTHIESLADQPHVLNHQLINYIVSNESGSDVNQSLLTNIENAVGGSVLLESVPTHSILQTTQLSLLPSSQYELSPPLVENSVQCSTLQVSAEGRALSTLMPVQITSSDVPVTEITSDTW